MTKDVSGTGSWKEEFLALTFVLVFLVSFVFVGVVDARWETTTTEQVWVSDGHAIVPHYDLHTLSSTPYEWEGNLTAGTLVRTASAVHFWNDTTMLFDGNDTWIVSYDASGVLTTSGSRCTAIFELKDANIFLANSVDYRIYSGNMVNVSNLYINIDIIKLDGEIDTGDANTDQDILATHTAEQIAAPSTSWQNGTGSISLSNALDIYSKAQIANTKVYITVVFPDADGWALHDVSIKLSVNGTYQKGLSAHDLIYYGLALSAGVNIMVGLFMTDSIDMPAIKKVWPFKKGGG